MSLDTVAIAQTSPDTKQPFAELGLKPDEYARIKEILNRRPTSSELAMYSVMWSEHCSYKSSKVHLKQFGEKAPHSDALLVGIGENAGVVDVGQGYAVTFKIESHNHPSFIEPYQGAATGIGGIVRDILTMGARPIAVMDPLRFGPADALDTKRVLPGIVAGIGGYGNCLGLPNIGGEITFDQTYLGNPLVNALCVGVMRHEQIKLAKASGAGNLVVLFGAKTGGDGIGGVSVLASETFGASGPAKRPSVQEKCGAAFVEKVVQFMKDEKKVCITEERSLSLFDEVILCAVKWQDQICINARADYGCRQRRVNSKESSLKKRLKRIGVCLVSFMY